MSAEAKLIESYLKNPYWKELYDGAPSEACRRMAEYNFTNPLYVTADAETKAERDAEKSALLEQLTKEDFAWLGKYGGNNPWGAYCRRMSK